jgi:hypothetical protein
VSVIFAIVDENSASPGGILIRAAVIEDNLVPTQNTEAEALDRTHPGLQHAELPASQPQVRLNSSSNLPPNHNHHLYTTRI